MIDGRRRRQPRVGAPQVFRHIGMQPGEALDVDFIDHRVVPRNARRTVVAPVERRLRHPRQRSMRRAVLLVEGRVVPAREGITVNRRVPVQIASDRLRIRIEQNLVRIESGAPAPDRTGHAPGNRRAAPARLPADSRARRDRSSPAARSGATPPAHPANRTNKAPPSSHVRRTARSSRPRRPTSRRGDRNNRARRASVHRAAQCSGGLSP
jgi:hypothetical protein